jgi:hypothetical protein
VLGLERPPRWATVCLVALILLNGALLTYLALRPGPSDPVAGRPAPDAQTAESPAAAAEAAAPTAPPSAPPVLAVYGDGYSTGSAFGGQGEDGWPALVATALGAELRLHAVSMAGYEAVGATGQDLGGIVAENPVPQATVTVVFASRNDLGAAAAAAEGAAETYRRIRAAAPQTQLIVVGPTWSNADVPADLPLLRDAVQAAANAAGATFVDPVSDGWFSEPDGLIAADGVTPTNAGHAFIAGLITPVVKQVLAAA